MSALSSAGVRGASTESSSFTYLSGFRAFSLAKASNVYTYSESGRIARSMLLIKSSYASQSQVFSSGSFFLSFLSTGLGFS
jgi:hypothetical protein